MILTGDALRVAAAVSLDPVPEPDEASVDVHVPERIDVEPHSYTVIDARERLTMPGHCAATITGRSSHMRAGVTMPGGYVDPGFEGPFALEFFNHGDETFVIEEGESAGRLTFHPLRQTPGPEPRFWSKVEVGQPSQCWEWQASKRDDGYGQFRFHGQMRPAHRVAFTLCYGAPAEHVLHKCHNRSCVNPHHLYSGSNADNVQDRIDAGNQPKGEDVASSELTAEEVREIRERYENENISQTELAEEFNVAQSNVSRVVNHKHWEDAEGSS